MYCTASITVTIFQCRPIIRAFDKATPGTCINTAQFWFANAGFSIATDVIILLLPMPLVRRLAVPGAQKMALAAVFAVGIFAVITSCLRVTTLNLFATSPDNTYDIANVMWTIVEPNVAVVCSCLPTLRPLVVKLLPGLRSSSSSSKSHGSSHGTSDGYGGSSSSSSGKSRVAVAQGSQSGSPGPDAARRNWVELRGVKSSQGVHLSSVRRPNSYTGSEESILALQGPGPRDESPAGGAGIQKTVEYSIQYYSR